MAICKECNGTGLGDYPLECFTCSGSGEVLGTNSVADWLRGLNNDISRVEATTTANSGEINTIRNSILSLLNRVESLEDENRSLKIFVLKNILKDRANISEIEDLIENKYKISDDGNDVLFGDESLTVEELVTKDVIE